MSVRHVAPITTRRYAAPALASAPWFFEEIAPDEFEITSDTDAATHVFDFDGVDTLDIAALAAAANRPIRTVFPGANPTYLVLGV